MLENFTLDKILRTALAHGGEYADIYFEEGDSTQVVVEDGKVEKVLAFSDRGVGIRVISDLRTAFGYTNDVTEKSLLELAARISAAVRGNPFDRDIVVSACVRGVNPPIALRPEGIPLEEKIRTAVEAEKAARGAAGQVRQVMTMYRDGVAKFQTVNSLG